MSFKVTPKSILEGDTAVVRLSAAAENGLAWGIIDYQDGTKRDSLRLSGLKDSARTAHAFQMAGIFRPTLTLVDVPGEKSMASDSVFVRVNQLPQIINSLFGTEGSVTFFAPQGLAYDPEGDPFTVSVSPVSPGLVFQLNARKDTIVYYLTNPDDNGTKKGKVTVVDQKNRTEEKVIDIVFNPLDDISGRVHDRFEGTHLGSYAPAAVMHGPFTGWVESISAYSTVRVPVDAGGNYAFPKLFPANRTLRAFITNGVDSSFVATYQVAAGDQTFDIGVETNAGTGMPLSRLLAMYQVINFRSVNGMSQPGWLTGIDLKQNGPFYVYYLFGRDTAITWFNAHHFTAAQEDWLESVIQTRCFAHLDPAHRPRIFKGGPTDPVPIVIRGGLDQNVPSNRNVIIYANLIQQVTDGVITMWGLIPDGVYTVGRIALNWSDTLAPPYGISVAALVQDVGLSISGSGLLKDPYYNNRSTRSEHTTLDLPSIADMKLDWQVILELPGEYTQINIESKYFGLP
ncbi:MAG TPA: hypothetical protein VMF59_08225 [Bacteroidota bacterium]|nr:hypothetical protein [Bacteroidota bacterium]